MEKILGIIYLFISSCVFGQDSESISNPVNWTMTYRHLSSTEIEISCKVEIDSGWTIIGEEIPSETAIPFSIKLKDNGLKLFELSADRAPNDSVPSDAFGIQVPCYSGQVIFKQKIKLTEGQTYLEGEITYMPYGNRVFLPPHYECFIVKLEGSENSFFVRKDCEIIKNELSPTKNKAH